MKLLREVTWSDDEYNNKPDLLNTEKYKTLFTKTALLNIEVFSVIKGK